MQFAFGVGLLQQHQPGRGRQGLFELRELRSHQVHGHLAHHLKACQARTQACLSKLQQSHCGFQRGHRSQSRHGGGWLREQLQGGGGDDTQGALAADVEVAQRITGVVLAQAAQALPQIAVGGDNFQPQTQLARIAKAQHLRAACVGSQVAAHGAAAFGRQTQRKQQAFRCGGFLNGLQNATGLHRDGQVSGVKFSNVVQPGQAQQQLRARGIGHRRTHQAGVAALHHHAHAAFETELHHHCHLGGVAWPHDRQSLAAIAFAPVQLVFRQVAFGQHMRCADGLAQGIEQHQAAVFFTAASLISAKRQRTCSEQAAKMIKHSTNSAIAKGTLSPRSP